MLNLSPENPADAIDVLLHDGLTPPEGAYNALSIAWNAETERWNATITRTGHG